MNETPVNPSTKNNVIKIVGWGYYDYNAELKSENGEHNQRDYFSVLRERENCAGIVDQIEELVIANIVKNRFKFDGETHQSYKYGCPIVEVDGERMYYNVSWRHWGDIMAEAWTKIDGKGYCYMDFYMGTTEDKADFYAPIVGVHIDSEGNILNDEIDARLKTIIDGLYAEKQELKQKTSEMKAALWGCRKVLRNIDEKNSGDLIYKAFLEDVDFFCRLKEDPKKIDEEKAIPLTFDKWIELNEDVKKFVEPFEKVELEIKSLRNK